MAMTLEADGKLKYEVIEHQIRKRIAKGTYSNKLPGERVLAEEFGVNFRTVRKGMETLVEDGLIERISGKGSFVKRKHELTNTIGVVMSSLQGPLHSLLVESIEQAAVKHGMHILFKATDNDPRPLEEIYGSFASPGSIDGIIFWECAPAFPLASGLPCIRVMDEDSGNPRKYSNVITDDFVGGQLAVNHLLELGHEKIGIVLPQGGDSVYQERRLAAYISCMEEAGELPAEPIEVPGDWGKMNRIRPIRENRTLLKQFTEFTALFCFNDALAGEVIKYLKHHGISVPEDISVVGYDDTEFGWALDITSIRQPVKSIGKKAVELLVQQIQDEHAPKVQISFPPELVVRHSSGVQSLPVYN